MLTTYLVTCFLYLTSWMVGSNNAIMGDTQKQASPEAEAIKALPSTAVRHLEDDDDPETQTFTVKDVSFTLKLVKGGNFSMGCTPEQTKCENDSKPAHNVTMSYYYIGMTEITLKQFKAFIDATNYKTDADRLGGSYVYDGKVWKVTPNVNWKCDPNGAPQTNDQNPVIHVSYNDALAFCEWLSRETHKTYRLPTEAEWEFAARGGVKSKNTRFAGSDRIDEVGWYDGNAGGTTHPVGKKKANELGLFDMSGNVLEWCSDWFSETYYATSPASNPRGPSEGATRVMRGGSWFISPDYCLVSYRSSIIPNYRYSFYGFRIASPM